jgi:hypothetical protein
MTRSSRTTSTGAPEARGHGRVAALGVRDREPVAFEHGLDQAALSRIVVDDENRLGHWKTPIITGRVQRGTGLLLVQSDTAVG